MIRLKEAEQLGRILNHPDFKVDPIAAIYEHLKSTQPVMDEQRTKENKNGSENRKHKKSKALAMDFHLSGLNSRLSSIHLDDPVHISS